MNEWGKQKGFTIVELLIVVVVIAILAAITIIGYNGISNRAKLSTLQDALSQTATKLETLKTTNGTYPADVVALAAQGIPTSTITVYIANNTTANPNYCVTIVNGALKYSITSTSGRPVEGECVTNLVMDPRATAYSSGSVMGWRTGRWFGGAPAAGTYDGPVLNAVDGPVGITSYVRKKWTVSPTTIGNQGDTGFNMIPGGTGGIAVTAGDMYAVSAYLRPSTQKNHVASIYQYDSGGAGLARVYSGVAILPTGVWTRQTYIYTAPAGTSYFTYTPDISSSAGNGATLWAPNDTLDGTGAMITKGTSLYSYGDGDSPGWFWNGTPNSSTSTGPAVAQ